MTRTKKLLLLLATGLTMSMAAPCIAATTRGEVLLEGSNITLGDIFLNAGDKAGMIVGQAPAPGQKLVLDVTALNQMARANGFDWKPENNYERMTVIRDSNSLNAAKIKELVTAELAKVAPNKDLDVALDNQTLEIHRAKSEPLSYHFAEVKYDPIKSRFETSLIVDKAGSTDADVIKVSGRAMMMVQVAILNHNVTTGDALSERDIEWSRVAADKIGSDAVTDASRLTNSESRRSLNAGSVLHMHDLRGAKLVTKGSIITIAVETPYMILNTQGRAMADGAMGDTIQVMNTQSNRSVDAVVVASGKVSVSPGASTNKVAAK
ncbi:MAG: flagellar basal body P-ring formation chaperone FlgA [Alphaproteobacteria bacterium]|nr:flagellar basal body P-ring formation chaperone FlgA [Alphaproteobacteria bacterium]